jgi:hypothetical protein
VFIVLLKTPYTLYGRKTLGSDSTDGE